MSKNDNSSKNEITQQYKAKCAEMERKASGFLRDASNRKREEKEKREREIIAELDDVVSEMLEKHKVSVTRLGYKKGMKDGYREGISENAIERLKKDEQFAVSIYGDERVYYDITWITYENV